MSLGCKDMGIWKLEFVGVAGYILDIQNIFLLLTSSSVKGVMIENI